MATALKVLLYTENYAIVARFKRGEPINKILTICCNKLTASQKIKTYLEDLSINKEAMDTNSLAHTIKEIERVSS